MVYGIISSSSVQVKLSKCRSVCSSKYRNEILLIERRMHAFYYYFVVIVHSFSIEVVECRPLYVVSQRDHWSAVENHAILRCVRPRVGVSSVCVSERGGCINESRKGLFRVSEGVG